VLAPLRFEDLQFEDAVCGLCAFAMFCSACSFATRGQLLQFYCHLYRVGVGGFQKLRVTRADAAEYQHHHTLHAKVLPSI
jgi:hypothetical protein